MHILWINFIKFTIYLDYTIGSKYIENALHYSKLFRAFFVLRKLPVEILNNEQYNQNRRNFNEIHTILQPLSEETQNSSEIVNGLCSIERSLYNETLSPKMEKITHIRKK